MEGARRAGRREKVGVRAVRPPGRRVLKGHAHLEAEDGRVLDQPCPVWTNEILEEGLNVGEFAELDAIIEFEHGLISLVR